MYLLFEFLADVNAVINWQQKAEYKAESNIHPNMWEKNL